jgi:monofunctional biosynthetic peptidoglycan transglycosylase
MIKFKLWLRRFFSSFAKIIFPFIFTIIFLSPLFYYWGLLWISGISANYNSYFTINREGEIKFQKTKPKGWTTIKETPSSVVWPIIVSEDWGFYQHSGVDWEQLKIVLLDGLKNLSIKRGASTITQQVIKNLYLSDERSFFRKFNEIILAYYLESKVSKKWILEQYINLAEFDKNIFGVRSASMHYFKKSPYELRFKEGAFLAMLLPSPKKYSVSYYKRDLTSFARRQVSRILGKLVLAKIISREQMQQELATPFSWESSAQSIDMEVLESIINKIKSGEEIDDVETIENENENEIPTEQPKEEISVSQDESLSVESTTPEAEVLHEETATVAPDEQSVEEETQGVTE